MRLATFVDPQLGREARFGVVRGENMIDIVAAANALGMGADVTIIDLSSARLRQLGVLAHGSFTRHGIARAIVRARRGVEEDLVGRTHSALEAAGALRRAELPSA